MNLTDAYERIDLKDITYTSWHFKNEPDAIFSIPRHHVETLIKTDVKSFVTYIKKSGVVEKKVYPVLQKTRQ